MTRRAYILTAILGALLVWFLWAWYDGRPKISTRGYMAAHVPGAIADLPKKTITAKAEVYKDKKKAMKRLGMDEEDSTDGEELATAAEIPATPAGAKAVVFLNASTGKFRTVIKANPVPLMSFEKGTEIGLRYGVATGGETAASLFVRQDFARIGKAYLAAYGEVTTRLGIDPRPEAKAMLEISGRFNRLPGLE
jgi:hypothetical protein